MWNSKREFRTGSDYRCPKGHIIDSRCFCVVLNSRDGIRPGGVVPWGRMGFRRHERGASPPANPCVFVVEHHVGWANRSTGTDGVVLHRPRTLVSSSSSTTPLISSNRTIPGTHPGFPEFPSPPKNEKCRPRCCSSSTLPTFPFPLSISRDCPSLHIEGTVSILS